jgi:hypothetical protein
MLMPVQLPDDLVVAESRIEVRDVGPESPRNPTVMDGIVVPIDLLAGAD